MKHLIYFLLIFSLISTSVFAAADPCDPEPVNEVVQAAKEVRDEAVQKAVEMMDIKKTLNKLRACLDALSGSYRFGANLPSVDDLINSICDFANDQVEEILPDIQKGFELNPLPGFDYGVEGGVGGGTGSAGGAVSYQPGDVVVKDNSEQIAKDILKDIGEEVKRVIP